jgi:hypothetical protein
MRSLLDSPPPLHLQLEAQARAEIYRLYCGDQRKHKSEGYVNAYVCHGIKREPILQKGTNKMILRYVYDQSFTIRFPDRSEWKDEFQPNKKGGPVWYTDISKINEGTKVGVYCYGTRIKFSFSHGQYTTPGRSVCHQCMHIVQF